MKRWIVAVAVAVFTMPLFAGVTYQFQTVTDQRGGAGQMAGTASVDSGRMRLDLTKGDGIFFKDGSVVISKDGGQTLYVIDPAKKSYYEFNLADFFAGAGAMMKGMGAMFSMNISNQNVKVTDAGDGGAIEGYPTHKYVVNSSYDLNMKVMGMKTSSSVVSKSEIWSTDKLARDYMTFIQEKNFKTGMEDFDKLVASQMAAVKGFPLKQVMTSTTTTNGKPQTMNVTTTIHDIKDTKVDASRFEIPAGYRQVEAPMMAPMRH